MDYPFVKQTSENYSDHVTSILQSQESRRQITANTIRILLLEEQNNELRYTSVSEAREMKENSLDDNKVTGNVFCGNSYNYSYHALL